MVNYVNTRELTFCVAFNITVRASEARGASEAGQMSQPIQASKPALGDLSKLTALFKSKFRSI